MRKKNGTQSTEGSLIHYNLKKMGFPKKNLHTGAGGKGTKGGSKNRTPLSCTEKKRVLWGEERVGNPAATLKGGINGKAFFLGGGK